MPQRTQPPGISIASAASPKAVAADRSGQEYAGAACALHALCRQLLLSLLLFRTSMWTSGAKVVLLRVCRQTLRVLLRGFGAVGGCRVWWCVAGRGAQQSAVRPLPGLARQVVARFPNPSCTFSAVNAQTVDVRKKVACASGAFYM